MQILFFQGQGMLWKFLKSDMDKSYT